MADQNLGGGNPAGGDPNAGGGGGGNNEPGKHASGGGQQPGAGGGGNPGGGGNGDKQFSYKEDRTDWLPRHRYNQVNEKLTTTERELADLRAKLDQEQRRTRAALGIETPSKEQAEVEETKAALLKLFPKLAVLEKLDPDKFDEILGAAETARASTHAQHTNHAVNMITEAEQNVAQQLGVEKLSPTQVRAVQVTYRELARASEQERIKAYERGERDTIETLPTDSDFLARHERGDKALLKEVADQIVKDWFEPAKRTVTAAQARRGMRPVPRGGRERQIPASGGQKVDFSNDADFKKALLEARGQRE